MTDEFVKVVGCKDPGWWYAKDVGAYYPLVRIQKDGSFIVMHGSHNGVQEVKACIAKEDGELHASEDAKLP